MPNPKADEGDEHEGEEAVGGFIVAGGEASIVFEFGEAATGMNRVTDERSLWLAKHVLPHEPALQAWLQSRRAAGLEIDDIVQETYSRLIAADSVASVRNPKTYAFQTAYSVLLTHVRRSKIVTMSSISNLDLLGIMADEPSPEQQLTDRDELMHLAKAIASLPGRVQTVFKLRRVDGLSQREVAERLGISENTVEKNMSRGFLLMLKLFEHDRRLKVGASKSGTTKTRRGNVERNRSRD